MSSDFFKEFPGEIGSHLQQTILPLVIVDSNGFIESSGTGFYINNFGLMLTARHFIDDAKDVINNKISNGVNAELKALYIARLEDDTPSPGLTNVLLPIVKHWIIEGTDLAICYTMLPQYTKNSQPRNILPIKISLKEPHENDLLIGLGYHRGVGGVSSMKFDTAQSGGVVIQVDKEHPFNYPWRYPWFFLECDFEDGMSGGPIINEKFEVVGIISKGIGDRSEEIPKTAKGSLLFPLIDFEIEEPYHPDLPWQKTTIRKLIQQKVVLCDDETH